MRTWVGVSSVPAGFDSQAPAKAVGTLSWRVRVADVVLAAAVGSVLVGGMYFLMREIVLHMPVYGL